MREIRRMFFCISILLVALLIMTIILISKMSVVQAITKDNLQMTAVINSNVAEETEVIAEKELEIISLGEYTITHYCACAECCGPYADGKTASGTVPTAGRTVAMEGVPIGSQILIDGCLYTVEDRFGKDVGRKIDIYCDSHDEALLKGTYETEVYMYYWEE